MSNEFEDGKPLEDYVNPDELVNELNALEVKAEPNPEATQTLEVVAEPPIRNEKKPQPKKAEPPPKPAPPQPAVSKPQAVQVQQMPPPPPPPVNVPQQQPPVNSPPEPAEQPQRVFRGVDDFIETMAVQEGQRRYQEVQQNAYRNITALFSGELVLVPADQVYQQQARQQAPQQQPVPEPVAPQVPQQQVISGAPVDEQLRRINDALQDPSLAGNRVALLRKKCELMGVPFDEEAYRSSVTQKQAVELPVSSQKVNDGKPTGRRWSIKTTLALVGTVVMIGVAIVLLIGALQNLH